MTAWDRHLVRIEELGDAEGFQALLPAFLTWQVARWPRLAEARDALTRVRTRSVRVGDRELPIQWNPARATSTTAKVDAASIQQRPCFLCPGNLPAEEHGLPFLRDWIVLPNPAPILADHLVVAHRDHKPQNVRDALPGLLDFAVATAGAMTALYNGPKSGASAPDHLHLQAVRAGQLPEERLAWSELEAGRIPGERLAKPGGVDVWRATGAERVIVGFAGDRAGVEARVSEAIEGLGGEEPPLNLVVSSRGDKVLVLLFPRGAHRPACFFAEGPTQRIVSPGIIDMAGVVVTVRESDFEALDGAAVAGIYREVTLPPDRAAPWMQALVGRWSHG